MQRIEAVRVDRLELEQFRVYERLDLNVPSAGLRIVGPNGAGKTTILEAIELLSTTRPRRGAMDADLVRHGSGLDLGVPPYGRVIGEIDRAGTSVHLEVFIQRSEKRNTSKKLLRVADRPRRASDVVGLVPTVTFAPDDLEFVLGSPSVRRRFLDVLLSQTDRRYLRYLSRYTKILAHRNGLLRESATRGTAVAWDEFAYWDEQLIGFGSYILAARVLVLGQLSQYAARIFAELSPSTASVEIRYQPTIREPEAWWRRLVDDAGDTIEAAQRLGAAFEQQLHHSREADLRRGSTNIGPHRDDIVVTIGGHPLGRFGSRGQQRIAVLAIKLAEIQAVRDSLEMLPVMLLDDVLSELDERHQATLIDAARQGGSQVFITSTDQSLLEREQLSDLGAVVLDEPGELRKATAT